LVHLQKQQEPAEDILALTEREAEERLKQIQEEGTGLSRTPEWDKMVMETVERSHSNF